MITSPGALIEIEGIDASGKNTQSKLLAEVLGASLFSFPDYSTPVGQLLRSNLKGEWEVEALGFTFPSLSPPFLEDVECVRALVYQSLQIANRLEKAKDLIAALFKGHVVVDRYISSGAVYGEAKGLDQKYIEDSQVYLPQPDIHVLIDIDPELSLKRRPDNRDKYEKNMGLMKTVCEGYRDYWARKSKEYIGSPTISWFTVDGNQSIAKVHHDLYACVLSKLKQKVLT